MIKSTARFIVIASLFLVPVFPLIVANAYYFPFITGKAFYFRILVEIGFAAWIILAFADARYRPKVNMLTIAVTAFALIALLADLLGVNPLRSFWSNFERMEGWLTIIHLWMLYVMASSIFNPVANGSGAGESSALSGGNRLWLRWFNTWLAVAFIVACYGFAQLFGWTPIHQGSARIDASLGNAAYMAVYMLMSAGFAAYLFTVVRRNSGVGLLWTYGVLTGIFSLLLFETATRGTILGLIGGTMLALLLYAIFGKNESKRSRQISGGIIIFIILCGGIFWLNRNQPFVQKNGVLQRLATISLSETQTQARAYIWPMALKGWTERPILGWGQENFNYIFNANYNPKMWTQEQWFDRAHSVFLDWLVASGIVGLLAYVSLYVIALIIIWKSHQTIAQKSVLTGLIAGYAVHNVAVFDNLASYVAFFALLSFVGSALARDAHIQVKGKDRKKVDATLYTVGGESAVSSEIVEYVIAPASIVVLVAALYFFNVRTIQANTALITAMQNCNSSSPDANLFEKVFSLNVFAANQETREQLISCSDPILKNDQLPGPVKQAFFQESGKAIQDQISAAPKDARMYVLGGQFMLDIGQIDKSLDLLIKAHALSPGKQAVNLELANLYINKGQTDKALVLLKDAYDEDPTYPAARTGYALGLIIAGQDSEATKLFGNDPAIFQSEQAAQIYVALKKYDKALSIYRKLAADNPSDLDAQARVAQVLYAAGRVTEAIQTMRDIEKANPQYKDQIEATIKQIQK